MLLEQWLFKKKQINWAIDETYSPHFKQEILQLIPIYLGKACPVNHLCILTSKQYYTCVSSPVSTGLLYCLYKKAITFYTNSVQ